MARRFGASPAWHLYSAKSELQDIRRLRSRVRTYLRSPPDCVLAADMMRALLLAEGQYSIDRHHSTSGKRRDRNSLNVNRSSRGLYGRFVDACVIKPKSAAAGRRMRSVWR